MPPSDRRLPFFRFLFLIVVFVGAAVCPLGGVVHAQTVRPERADLARAYLEFETAYRVHPPGCARVVEVNREFDRITLQFFAGDQARVLRSLGALGDSLYPEGSVSLASRLARSLRLRSTPANPIAGSGRDLVLRIESVFEIDLGSEESIDLEIRVGAGRGVLARTGVRVSRDSQRITARLVVPTAAISRDTEAIRIDVLETTTDGTRIVRSERIAVLPSDPDRVRESNLEFVNTLPEIEGLADARKIFAARNELLRDEPGGGARGPVPLDRRVLVGDLERERAALEAGEDPYRGVFGHSWRVVTVGSITVPLRLYVPARDESETSPMPLVIALHGAGGDENMFVEGYGAGEICRLADAYGFIVASPQTFAIGSSAGAFDRILETLRDDYAIDDRRIYLMGHSFGAGVASSLAMLHAERIAAVCTIAGAGRAGGEKSPPRLRIHGALDPLARGRTPTSGTRGPVRDRVFENYGHTLVVGEALPEAIAWLIAHRLP